MAEINERTSLHDSQLDSVLLSLLTDVTNVRSALNTAVSKVNVLGSKVNVLTTKLNSDGGVSDTNYATDFATDFAQATALTTTADE